MAALDDLEAISRLDREGMLWHIQGMPEQFRTAWDQALRFDLPDSYRDVDRVLVLGMGGSAIGGALLQALADRESAVPVHVHRGYGLPAWVSGRTLVIASSYSGGTEETISGFEAALALDCPKLALCTGGPLADLAGSRSIPVLRFSYTSAPRAAVGYSFASLLGVAARLGLLGDQTHAVEAALSAMADVVRRADVGVATPVNPAKRLAGQIQGRIAVVHGAEFLTPVAYRWRTQLNENAKVWAFSEELPEANHNSIVGYGRPRDLLPYLVPVFLRSDAFNPRNLRRYDATMDEMRRVGLDPVAVEATGEGALAAMMSTLLLGDYVSFYTAVLNDEAPTPVLPITFLKERMAAPEPGS